MTILVGQEKPSLVDLVHHGVKGQRWGVRKQREPAPSFRNPAIKASVDGSITIAKGANIQRLTRSSGKSLPLKDITYASINDYDNARYVKIIGGKGFLGGGRDQILGIKTTVQIKAPSHDASTKIVSGLLIKDQKFRESVKNPLNATINDKELQQIKNDPGGKTAQAWYYQVNQSLTFRSDPYVEKTVSDTLKTKGFNALRDENDFQSKLAKAPVIIFSPEKNLKITSVTNITDELRKANKVKLKQYKNAGQSWIDKEAFE